MTLGSLTYAVWILSLALTSMALKSETLKSMLSYNQVYIIVIGASFVNGLGTSVTWVA